MIPEWEQEIVHAQGQRWLTINGQQKRRIRYGKEADDWGADRQPCHDCAVVKGQFHVLGCDVERCPNCGGQLISCTCDKPFEEGDEE
jgi:hypothetical protein